MSHSAPKREGLSRHGGASDRLRRLFAAVMTGALLVGLLPAVERVPVQALGTDFTMYNGAATSPVLIDPSYGGAHDDRDYRQVSRAVEDLRQDVAMVTGGINASQVQHLFVDNEAAEQARLASADQTKVPALQTSANGQSTAIIVGELGQSKLVDAIVDAGKFNEARQIQGKWEAYAIKSVDHPLPGVDRALVIAGSDARGTIYGIYSVSQRIGISPWYWFSDVPVKQRDEIVVDGSPLVDGGPDVKYRGIFINDEESTLNWATEKFPTEEGTPDVNYYRHVFEMMLRLKLDTLWPAMHPGATAFDAATDTGVYDAGTPINAREASAYGVIMSSSHAEPMLRSNEKEWPAFYERNKDVLDIKGSNYTTAYNYSINKPAIIEYWRERLVANADFENLIVLGIRGIGDSPAAFTANNPYGFHNTVEMVGDAITEQRNLIKEVYGSADAVPQVFVPYKEVATLYNNGLKAYIPDDVTLMWSDDNYGYLRQVPTHSEALRSGGNGVYYHSEYWGDPQSYLWLNSTPMSLMVQQLHRAWNSGAGRFWILNVGDIKPGELKTELFAKLAWNVDGYNDANIESKFLVEQMKRDFALTGQRAVAAAEALARFDALENKKRAEFWGTDSGGGANSGQFPAGRSFPFSATSDGDELQRYINESNTLVGIFGGVWSQLDAPYRSAFYQQVLHRVRSYRNMAEQIGYYWKNQLDAAQGRYGSARIYAILSKRARDRIISDQQYWDTLGDGKWDQIMSFGHGPQGVVMLADDAYATPTSPVAEVGADAEGQQVPGTGTLQFNAASPDDQRFFDVFSKNDGAQQWVARTDAPWITLSQVSGQTATEQRVTVAVDWSRLATSATGTIQVYNAVNGAPIGDPVATFPVGAQQAAVDLRGRPAGCQPSPSQGCTPGYLEANGYVAIEAEHFSENLPGADGSQWRPVEGIGQRGAAMEAFPETAPRVDADFAGTAQLKYRVYFTSTGQFTGTFYRIPTLNEGTDDAGAVRSARTAIGIDDQIPASANLRGCAQTSCGNAWGDNVMRGIEPLSFTINVPTPGWHDIVVYRSDAAILFDRIIIETIPGTVGDGLVGPTESPNNIAAHDAVQQATIAPLPVEVAKYHPLPAITVSVGETHTVDNLQNVVTAESDNDTAASVALDNGTVSITGHRVGIAEITLSTRDDELSSFTVTVNRANGPQLGAYQEKDGLVVIDPTDALEKSTYANAIDSNNGTHTWTLKRNGMQTVPVASAGAKANWLANSAAEGQALLAAAPTQHVNGSAAPGTPPRLEFTVDIQTPATYYLFVNTSNPNDNADSYHVAVDGQWKYQSSKGGSELGVETWYGSTSVTGAALPLAPGQHTISLWTREAGFLVNQIALTTNPSPGLTGFQTPSPRAE